MTWNELSAGLRFIALDTNATTIFTTATNSVNMQQYRQVLCVLDITDVGTGMAVTLNQGTTSTASTALSFTKYYYAADLATSSTLVEGTASGNTFTTGTASKRGIYIVPIDASQLTHTQQGEYSYVRLNGASAAGASASLYYIAGFPRMSSDATTLPSVA